MTSVSPDLTYPTLLVGLLALLLVAAAISDLRSRSIANWLNAAIALGAIPFWFAIGLDPWPAMAIQLGLALATFALFAIFFALGAMGGGDVKMIAALALWLPAGLLIDVLMIMAVAGGLLTVVVWLWHKARGTPLGDGVPYGVAIAIAGIWAINQQYINQFA
jgi:prepilin peptidase CpaA